jgi:hypothetical protein
MPEGGGTLTIVGSLYIVDNRDRRVLVPVTGEES